MLLGGLAMVMTLRDHYPMYHVLQNLILGDHGLERIQAYNGHDYTP